MSKLSDYSKFDHLLDDDDDDDDDNVQDNHVTTSTTRSVESSTLPSLDENVIRHVRKYPISSSSSSSSSATSSVAHQSTTTGSTTHLRFMAQYKGTTVYEWEQSLNEVILYIVSPLQKHQNQISTTNEINHHTKIICHITATHLQVGIQQQQQQAPSTSSITTNYYIDEDLYHPIDTMESTWCIEQEDIDHVSTTTTTTMNTRPQPKQQDVITIYLQKMAKGMVWDAPLRGHHHHNITTSHNNNNILDPIALQDVQKSLLLERWQEENPGMDFRDATFNNSGGSIPDPRTYMGGVGYQ